MVDDGLVDQFLYVLPGHAPVLAQVSDRWAVLTRSVVGWDRPLVATRTTGGALILVFVVASVSVVEIRPGRVGRGAPAATLAA
jgi:hypothetical protein